MEKVTYTVRHKDRTQAVYFDLDNGNHLIMDVGEYDGKELFRTKYRDLAYSVWQMTGGDYGDFEIVSEQGG